MIIMHSADSVYAAQKYAPHEDDMAQNINIT